MGRADLRPKPGRSPARGEVTSMLHEVLVHLILRVRTVLLLTSASLLASSAAAHPDPTGHAGVPTTSAHASRSGGDKLEAIDGTWHELLPSPGLRSDHSAIYDAARHRMV